MKHFIALLLLAGMFLTVSGQPWHHIPVLTDKQLNTIDFPSTTIGYIGGNDSLLLKTTDGGRTWQEVTFNGINFSAGGRDITHLEFLDENNGYAVVQNSNPSGSLYQTSDGGLNWTAVNAISLCFSRTTYFFDANNGIVGGNSCFSGETIQRISGGNWQTTQILGGFNTQLNIEKIDFLDNNFGMAVGNSPYIFVTTDGGINWDSISYVFDTLKLTDVVIMDDTLAYATSSNLGNGLLISTDGGQNWEQDVNSATFSYPFYNALHKTPNGRIYAGGQPSLDSSGYIQTFQGLSWFISLVKHRINDIKSYGDSTVFAVGDSGYIVTNVDPSVIGIKETSKSHFSISPNPSGGVFQIKSAVNKEMNVIIYDLQGREMRSMTSKNDVIHIDLSNHSRGMYLVRIRQDNRDYIEKIMITEN